MKTRPPGCAAIPARPAAQELICDETTAMVAAIAMRKLHRDRLPQRGAPGQHALHGRAGHQHHGRVVEHHQVLRQPRLARHRQQSVDVSGAAGMDDHLLAGTGPVIPPAS